MSKHILTLTLACLALAGCASRQDVVFMPPMAYDKIAADASEQLAEMAPPAHTQLNMPFPEDDIFGLVWSEDLRKRGFGVTSEPLNMSHADNVRYLLTTCNDNDVYLTIKYKDTVFSRLYNADQMPLGGWAKGKIEEPDILTARKNN